MALNEKVKRHLQFFGERYLRGERVIIAFKQYIYDLAIEGTVLPDDAKEIYDTFLDTAVQSQLSIKHDKESTSYLVQISKIKRIIKEARGEAPRHLTKE